MRYYNKPKGLGGLYHRPKGRCFTLGQDKMDLTEAHWQVWMEEFRKEMPMGEEPKWDSSRDYDEATVVLKKYGENKAAVLTAIKMITGLSTVEAYQLLTPESKIKIGVAYIDAKHSKKMLEDAGAKVAIMEYIPMKNN